jgi:hypothetical protein
MHPLQQAKSGDVPRKTPSFYARANKRKDNEKGLKMK